MAQAPSVGTLSAFGASLTTPVNAKYEYKSFTLGKHNTVLSTDGIRGTRAHPVERTRAGTYTIGGNITFEPGPTDLDFWLNVITGGTKDGSNNFSPAETLPYFSIGIDRIAQMHTYNGCVIDKATFKASQGSLLELALDIEGKTEVLGAIAGFSALAPTTQAPYVLMDAVLTYGGTTYQFREVELVYDNAVKKDRFMNSISRTDIPALDRIISLTLSLPYTTDTTGLYDQNVTSGNVVITFTNGALNFTITCPAVQFPTEPPETPGRDEILLPLRGIARKTGSTAECTLQNKSS